MKNKLKENKFKGINLMSIKTTTKRKAKIEDEAEWVEQAHRY